MIKDLAALSYPPFNPAHLLNIREVVGLNKHIGLDLFSDDSGLVIAGDMHQMPFENNYFNFIFMKNVVDKSYNIRTLVEEIIRVIEPSGIVAVDQVCGYGRCNPLTRTDIQRADNLLKVFQSRCEIKVLVCQDIDISGIGDSQATSETRNNARLAFQILSK
jgi:SAM-dependent methyltransferase